MPSVYMRAEDGASLTVHIWASLPLWFQPHSAGLIGCLALTAPCGWRMGVSSWLSLDLILSFIFTVDFAASCFLQTRTRIVPVNICINRTAGTDIFHSLIAYFLFGSRTSFIRKVLRLKLDLHGHDCERFTLTYSHMRAENDLAF